MKYNKLYYRHWTICLCRKNKKPFYVDTYSNIIRYDNKYIDMEDDIKTIFEFNNYQDVINKLFDKNGNKIMNTNGFFDERKNKSYFYVYDDLNNKNICRKDEFIYFSIIENISIIEDYKNYTMYELFKKLESIDFTQLCFDLFKHRNINIL